MRRFVLDLDDTLAYSTRDLLGDPDNIPQLQLVEGAMDFLKRHHRRCILLTAGDTAEQQQKIEVLGIRKCFKEIFIVPRSEDKKEKLRQLVELSGIDPAHIAVIGDRLDVEIRTGNELGCTTVRMQLPGGNHSLELPKGPLHEVPHHTVQNWIQLFELFP